VGTEAQRQAIIRAAHEAGIDPSAALEIDERESNFDPNARSSKTIAGMFQMTGGLRRQYGIGDSNDPYEQAKGWAAFFKDNKGEMARVLGRDPTDAEGYSGHHFGSIRAARMMKMDPSTPVDAVFTPNEMSINPHFAKAGTVGSLLSSVTADIGRRQAKFGGDVPDLSEFGTPAGADNGSITSQTKSAATSAPDLSSFGTPAEASSPSVQPPPSAPDLSQFGTPAV